MPMNDLARAQIFFPRDYEVVVSTADDLFATVPIRGPR